MKSFKTAWNNIRRSPYQAFAASCIMTLIFLLISYYAYILLVSSRTLSFFESKPTVTVFFKNETKQSDIDSLKSQLKSSNKISNIKFVSKQEALAIYREQNKDDPLLLDLVTADILPSSLEISTVKINDLSKIYDELKKSSLVENVIFQKDVVSDLSAWIKDLREAGLAAIIILSLVSVFVTTIIIGIKVSQKKEDIGIMRLLGARGWYISWPFLLEGMLYGAVSAIMGWVIASVYIWYNPPFPPFMQEVFVSIHSPIFLVEFLAGEIIFALILSFLASFVAVFRYLK